MVADPPNDTPAALNFTGSTSWTCRAGVGLFLASLVLYAATANRGPQWQDSGLHILRVVDKQVVHPLGLALSHPLHHYLARLAAWAPIFEPCFAVTLVSSLAAAVAVLCVFGCVVTLTGRCAAGVFAATSLMLAHTFWQMATLAETYTLVAALLAAECWCVAGFARTHHRGWLFGMSLLNGLGIVNHLLASLTTPVLLVVVLHAWVKRRVRGKDALLAAGLWLVGGLPYSGLVLTACLESGDVGATIKSALFGNYAANVLNTSFSPRVLLIGLIFPLYNFPNLLLLAAGYGLVRARRASVPPVAIRALLAGLVIHALFALRYDIIDQQSFFVPLYVLLSIIGGIGAAAAATTWSGQARHRAALAAAVLLVTTPIVYAVAPTTARHARLLERTVGPRNKPYRDDYAYLLTPWSIAERSAADMSRHALRLAQPGGLIIVEDPMAVFAVQYQLRITSNSIISVIEPPLPENDDARAKLHQRMRTTLAAGEPVVLVPRVAHHPACAPPGATTWRAAGLLYVLDAP